MTYDVSPAEALALAVQYRLVAYERAASIIEL